VCDLLISFEQAKRRTAKGTESAMSIPSSVVESIGNTPIVPLRKIVPPDCARILAKLEWANPTGSMKDRMARAAIEGAESDGRLLPGGTVVEYTAGTTGISLALVCAAKGYKLNIVFSDAFSEEKRMTMRALGAEITDVLSENREITATLIKAMIETARQISAKPGHWWCDQLNNQDAAAGYTALGEEIWDQTGGQVDAFVHAVGTAHSIHSVTRALRRHKPDLHVTAVEPAESAVLSGKPSGSHHIEGIGIGFIPPLWEPRLVDEILAVSTAEAQAMARWLAREEGLFAGTSSGANVAASLRVAERLGSGATVVTILCDSGLRYLSTELYKMG
jgi:cysteine synthase